MSRKYPFKVTIQNIDLINPKRKSNGKGALDEELRSILRSSLKKKWKVKCSPYFGADPPILEFFLQDQNDAMMLKLMV